MYRKEVIIKLGCIYPRAVNEIHNAQKRKAAPCARFASVLGRSKAYYVPGLLAKRLCNYYYIYVNIRLVFF